MYTAMILVALASGPMVLKDTRGPYVTETECKARVVAMRDTILKSVPGVLRINGRCKRDAADGVPI